jgi:CheY-like chemotaxis protein
MYRNSPILIVEDSDDDYYTAARVIGKFGAFPLRRCSRGNEVLEQLAEKDSTHKPMLIFLDLNLPGTRDGRTVLIDLKADARPQNSGGDYDDFRPPF